MRVLIFTSQINLLGGAERLAIELSEALNLRPNVHADVLVMVPEGHPNDFMVRHRLLKNGVPSVRFLGREAGRGAHGMLTAIHRLRAILREGEYELIETSMMGPSILAAWARKGLHTRHVVGIHDIYLPHLHRGTTYTFWKCTFRMSPSTRYYAISDIAARNWDAFLPLSPGSTTVIANSIHQDFFHAKNDRNRLCAELQIDPFRRMLLFVGRLAPRKGLDTLIEAALPLCESGRCTLLIVGSPNNMPEIGFGESTTFVQDMRKKSKNAKSSIFWLGWRRDVPRLMASADALIHPARHEGFGLVLAEALAAGLPVISTNASGIPDVLAGTDAILVPPDNPEELRTAITHLFSWSELERQAAVQKGRIRAQEFTVERRVAAMLSLFNDAINQSNSRRQQPK